MTDGSLDQLLRELDRHVGEDPKGSRVARMLESYARSAEDWRKYALFEATYYSRNLVRRCELYELIVLCWGVGQRSPIHDHAQQRCWMAVLDGQVRETIFQGVAENGGTLKAGPVRTFERGSVAYIVDEIGWHRIEPAGAECAITLHLYSRPIGECRVYDEAKRCITSRTMSYHSVDGVPMVAAR